MPSKSKSQQRLMGAALGGAQFPAAQKIEQSMSLGQMRDFARGPMTGKPEHVTKAAPKALNRFERKAIKATGVAVTKTGHPTSGHPGKNLGHHLRPKKGGK